MKNIFLIISFCILASACGNGGGYVSKQQSLNSYTGTSSITSGNSYLSADLTCSETVNIRSNNGSASANYRGCRQAQASTSIQLFTADYSSQSVCVFPAINGRASPSVYRCGTVNTSGAAVSFAAANFNFNGVYVVSQADARALQLCAQYGEIPSCAAQANLTYAYGNL